MPDKSPEARVREIEKEVRYKLSKPIRYPLMSFMEQRRYLDLKFLRRKALNDAPLG